MKSPEDWLKEMMNPDQVKIVVQVYNHLLENEKRGWDGLDDYIDYLEYLDNDQLHREVDVLYFYHSRGPVRCQQNHAREKCFIPIMIDAVGAIINLYKETGNLHEKNRYILQYYLAMNQAEMIVVGS